MLRRILLLSGETASSKCAWDYAFRLARESGADLTGLAGVDLTRIEVAMPGAVGATTYRSQLEQRLKKQADDAP